MSSRTPAQTSTVPVAIVVVMAFSVLVGAALRRDAIRTVGRRWFSTTSAAATLPSSSSEVCCCAAQLTTIDPVMAGENSIERRLAPEIKALHAQAVARGEDTYTDPRTGFTVFTRLGLLRNMKCCGSRCRHCPYGHVNVQSKRSVATKAEGTDDGAPTSAAANAEAMGPVPKHSVVYTKTGDKGTSALFTGERRKKTDAVFEALGALDELSSHVGLARAMIRNATEKRAHDDAMMDMLEAIQQELLNAGTVVATPTAANQEDETAKQMTSLLEGYKFAEKTAEMENSIDLIDHRLAPLRIFILPGGGNVASAQLHVCRTVCRRAERRMIEVRDLYGEGYTDHLRQATVYVNRLSDWLFVAARSVAEEDIVRKYN